MSKNPSTTWYFNDWENDPALKACSLAAQGLWMRLLCIAARSPEHGVVQIGSLTCSLPDGLAHLASAVGRPPQEIAPLIDELISSGAASQDRKGRLTSRRMTRAAKVSEVRSESGRNGAAITNEKRWGKRVLGQQNLGNAVDKPSASSRLPASSSSSHGKISTDAPSAPASGDARSGSSGLTPDSVWRDRLEAYKPWLGERTWKPFWGPRPDQAGHQPAIPAELLRWWRAQAAQARTGAAA